MRDDDGKPVWYRLLFTKDDDLDLTQVFFAVAVIFAFVAFAKVARGDWTATTAAWAFLGSVFATLAIAGTPKWIAELLSKTTVPGDTAQHISAARTYAGDTTEFPVQEYLTPDDIHRPPA
jgi:hypothetical protein